MKKFTEAVRSAWRTCFHKVNKFLDAAFPKKRTKQFFLFFIIAVEIAAAYLIAYLQVGIWSGDYSIPGMVAAYIRDADTEFPFLLYLLLSAVMLIAIYFKLKKDVGGNTGRGFDISESNVYGSARDINEEELREIADIVPKEAAMGDILGQLDQTEKRLITMKPLANYNKNSIYLAPPGSGKTFSIVLPKIVQAIRRGESVVTTDTKGELWAKTVELARRHGYIVRRIDLKDPKFSDGWDILGEIRHDDIRAKIFSSIYIANTGSGGERDTDIHAAAEENLLAALALYTDLNTALAPEEKTLYNTYTMLMQGPAMLDQMFSLIQYDPELRVAYDSYASFQGSENLRNNIVAGLAKRLNIVTSPAIREMTSTPDVDLTLPGQRKCIYYVEMPDQHQMTKCLGSLFFSFLFLDLTDYADAQMSQRLPVPVNVIIEEAYAVGKLPTITNALGTVRSRGIGITLIAQALSQFQELYGETVTKSILNCCSTYGCLSANEETSAELFSWMSGTATVKVKTERHNIGEGPVSWGRGYSTGEGRQELYSGNDVRKIKFGRILLVWQRYDPIMAYTFGIDRHPEFINGHMPQILATTKINIQDKEARAYLRAKEEERVMQYEQWIRDGGNPWPDYTEPKPPSHRGPASGKPLPETIPYPKLEEMALAHSAQASVEAEDTLLRQMQGAVPIPPVPGFEPPEIPPDFAWEDLSEQSGSSEENPVGSMDDNGRPDAPSEPSGAAQEEKAEASPKATEKPGNRSEPTDKPPVRQRTSNPRILERQPPTPSMAGSLFGEPPDEGFSPFKQSKKKAEGQKKDKLQNGATKLEL